MGNASLTSAGQLTWSATPNSGWEDTLANGPVLYSLVDGDFDVSVRVANMTTSFFSDGGLIARVPGIPDAGPGEDYLAVRYFGAGGFDALRSTDNSSSVNTNFTPAQLESWLRLTRVGSTFRVFAKLNQLDPWVLRSTVLRNDIGAVNTLQVGLWFGTFSGNVGTVRFDDFSLSGPNVVPEPSTLALGLAGGLALLVLARRKQAAPRRQRR